MMNIGLMCITLRCAKLRVLPLLLYLAVHVEVYVRDQAKSRGGGAAAGCFSTAAVLRSQLLLRA